ncbi:hypothetical protein GCM10008905_33140 [Clostridium malenominatum]|uniref:Polymerase beta nucleotidyltransferase domain-containing protein n=1 Tax=Clostridium malenominatum TaxID=1539 RepID=A0ABN1J7L5_9CLOT
MGIKEDKHIILEKLNSPEFLKRIRKSNISTVIIFGSICTDEFHELSDVDIALLSEDKINLDNILDIELFLERYLQREVDVLDLRSNTLDIFIKMNILNSSKVIYSSDENKLLQKFCEDTHRIYKENEDFIYFRRMDVLS